MKLTFFEKELFDNDAFEKPTISINSQDATQRELVKKIATPLSDGAFVSGEKNKAIRTIKIPAEYLDFFKDGTKFTGTFKHTKLTSGEPEIVSRTTAPQVTKPINVSYNANVRLRALEVEIEREVPPTNIQVNPVSYEPYLILRLGGSVFVDLSEGFAGLSRFIRQYTATGTSIIITAYQAVVNYFRGRYGQGFFSRNKTLLNLTATTPESALPENLLTKETTSALRPTTIATTQNRVYPGFIAPYSEIQYWNVSGVIRNRFKIKEYSLRGVSTSPRIVLPCRQELSYDSGATVYWANANGTRRLSPLSVSLDSIYPKSLTRSNFTATISSVYSRRSATAQGTGAYPDARISVEGYLYSYLGIITLSGFESYLNLLVRGSGFNGFNSSIGTVGGGQVSGGFGGTLTGKGVIWDVPPTPITLTRPSVTAQRNQIYYLGSSRSEMHFTEDNTLQSKASLDNEQLARLNNNINSLIDSMNRSYTNISFRGGRSPINIYQARPLRQTDWARPVSISRNDLGLADSTIDINNIRQSGNLSSTPAPTNVPNQGQLNTDGSVYRNFYYRLSGTLRLSSAFLMSAFNVSNATSPGTNELKRFLPIPLGTDNDNYYDIVNIDFNENEIYIRKNRGESVIGSREIEAVLIGGSTGRLREVSMRSSRASSYNSEPVRIYESNIITSYFRPMFTSTRGLSSINGVRLPTFSSFYE